MFTKIRSVAIVGLCIAGMLLTAQTAQASVISPTDPGGLPARFSPNGLPGGPTGIERYTFLGANSAAHLVGGIKPSGSNDFACKPAAGTNPIVLVPGTAEDAYSAWAYYSPELKKRGYCVFTFNYNGWNNAVFNATEWGALTGDITSSAAFLANFVDRVLAASGASKVDIIGHSQGGGPLPRTYLASFGGAKKVARLIGLVPSNHGTTAYGLNRLLNHVGWTGGYTGSLVDSQNLRSLPQQLAGSAFINNLNSGTLLFPGVKYTVISTRYDDVVTPHTNSFLAGAKNITMQDLCKLDMTDHFGATYDPIMFKVVLHELNPNSTEKIGCQFVPPAFQ